MNHPDIHGLAQVLGYTFKDERLILQALTHSSWSNEHPADGSNERMEYMGDAVLGFVVAGELYARFPDWDEGMLTAAKSYLVGKDNLAEIARRLDLFSYLRLGTGEERGEGAVPPSLGVDALEAVIGAVFLDGGIDEARRLILRLVLPRIEQMQQEGIPEDPKSRLQEYSLRKYGKLPVYRIEEQAGPDHERHFVFSVTMPDGTKALGRGPSKKEAQKDAAGKLIESLQ